MATSELHTFAKPLRCRRNSFYWSIHQSTVYMEDIEPVCSKSCLFISVRLWSCCQSLSCFSKRFKKMTRFLLLGKVSRMEKDSKARWTSEESLKMVTSMKMSQASSRRKANRLLTADLLPNGSCLSAGSERQMGQHAFKKSDMKQAQVQSLPCAVLLAAPKTVTNLIPSSIIQRLFGSDNTNLYRGKASGGAGQMTEPQMEGKGGWWMGCICVLVCQRYSLGFWFFFFLFNIFSCY